jgi:hypothetical protein
VLVGEDRRIEATAIGVRVGPQYAHRPSWVIASPDGTEVASGHMPMPGETELSVEVPEPGLYQLQANAGMNGCGLVVRNAPAVMVGPGMQLCEWPGAMYFWVPDGCEQFTVTLFAGKGESAAMEIYRPNGDLAFTGNSLTRDAVPATIAPAPAHRGQAWRLVIDEAPEGQMEDYSVLLGDALPPYLATSPGAMLVPAGD